MTGNRRLYVGTKTEEHLLSIQYLMKRTQIYNLIPNKGWCHDGTEQNLVRQVQIEKLKPRYGNIIWPSYDTGTWYIGPIRASIGWSRCKVSLVCFTNCKGMAPQRQIWSTFFFSVLWFRKTEIQVRAGILVLVRVLWVTWFAKFTDLVAVLIFTH